MTKFVGLLVLALGRGCLPTAEEAPVTVQMQPLAHVPGTLLRDRHDQYWVVDRWPDRRQILDRFIDGSHLRRGEAIPLSAEEERCLRPSNALWYPRNLWRLARLNDGSLWYVNDTEYLARQARVAVIDAWRDLPDQAPMLAMTFTELESRYRVLEPMLPPEGALFRTPNFVAIMSEGKIHLFESQTLAEQVGYRLRYSTTVSEDTLRELAPFGETLTPSSFAVCPLAAAQLRASEDQDHDGVPFFQDCDDDDARRHPGHVEICDGVDNDCDLIPDNGFNVGVRCIMNDDCNSTAYRRCADHRLGTICWDDEVTCHD